MKTKRSGIANIVGAVFFILIVVLMVGALAALFLNFNGFVEGQHTSEQTTQQQQQASLNVKNLTYGGQTSYDGLSYTQSGAVNLVPNSNQHPILPISNMNFTGSMADWTTSHTYDLVTDAAMAQLSPQYITYPPSFSSPQTLPFTLTVFNQNALGSPFQIAKVSLLVDGNWGVPTPQPTSANWGSTQFATGPPNVVGNNITWVSNLPFDIAANGNWVFPVSLNVPRDYGTFYDTVVVSWVKNNVLPVTDTAIATVNSTTARPLFSGTTSSPTSPTILMDNTADWAAGQWVGDFLEYTSGPADGQSELITANDMTTLTTTTPFSPAPTAGGDDTFVIGPSPGTSSALINPTPNGVSPSGLTAGYDSNALTTTSLSGPGSMYLDFKPSFNAAPIVDGQQLAATTDYTTAFTLDYKTVSNIVTAACCSLTWESSLDSVNAPRNSLILYQAYLTSPPIPIATGTTTGGTSQTMLQDTAGGWAPGAWIGDYLLYTSGPATGESLMITGNSAISITTAAFNPAPTVAGGDEFMITIHPKGLTYELPVGGTSCGALPNADDYVNPTTINDFGPTGWVEGQVCFNPSTNIPAWLNGSIWYTGTYTLTVAVTATVPGAFPQTTGYPPEVSVHLDDIGLALTQAKTTFYGQKTFDIPTGLNTNQVQGVEIGVNATGTNQNTTLYAYVTDNSHFVYNPPNWVEIGSVSLINSAVIDSVSHLPNAAYYVNSTNNLQGGKPVVGYLTVRVNATSSVAIAPYSVNVVVWAVIQTFNETRMVVELQNQSPVPVHLLTMVITGPGDALTYSFPTNYFFSPGQKLVLPETFTWIPGSTYTVTVTTASGLTFSRSFPAPLA